MTYNHKNILGLLRARAGAARAPPPASWGAAGDKLWLYLVGCHYGHYTEFLVALLCYRVCLLPLLPQAGELDAAWVVPVYAFNLAVGWALNSFWHWMAYAGPYGLNGRGPMVKTKFNVECQYEPGGAPVRMFRSTTGQLEREICYNTLGWLQSATLQILMMHLWASGRLPYYTDFWADPAWSLFHLGFVTYWREIHFYWCHRFMHPWRRRFPLVGDPGKFIYKVAHSLHHKSTNPGPWSGLSMHPLEHFLYYSCAWLPFFITLHPLHFLYAKFHADIAPIAGHDGFGEQLREGAHGPAIGSGDFHYLHHAKYDCNYGVPFPFNFDAFFGTWMDWDEYQRTRTDPDWLPKSPKRGASIVPAVGKDD